MSRLSGFIAKKGDIETFSVTWKNYLNVDGLIWKISNEMNVFIDSCDDDSNSYTTYRYSEFLQLIAALHKRLTRKFFNDNDHVMNHTVDMAVYEWREILNEVEHYLAYFDEETLKEYIFIHFSCN